jgi:uncharacterized phage protein (TIGR01671 family)
VREIKFRAWDSDNYCYVKFRYPPNGFIAGGMNKTEGLLCISNQDHRRESVIIEQFTGYSDIRGIDIFEGDILKVGAFDYMKVVFINGSFTLLLLDLDPLHEIVIKYSDKIEILMGETYENTHLEFEVIGNIHENPELIS